MQRRDPHPVEVDQPQPALLVDDDVAVLEIAVREPGPLQLVDELEPPAGQLAERVGVGALRQVANVLIQLLAFDPFHLEHRPGGALSPYRAVVPRDLADVLAEPLPGDKAVERRVALW